jgi:hypothetical protein
VISDLAVGMGAPLVQYDSADTFGILQINRTGRNKNRSEIQILDINSFSPGNYKIKLNVDIKMGNLSPMYPVTPAKHKYELKVRT